MGLGKDKVEGMEKNKEEDEDKEEGADEDKVEGADEDKVEGADEDKVQDDNNRRTLLQMSSNPKKVMTLQIQQTTYPNSNLHVHLACT